MTTLPSDKPRSEHEQLYRFLRTPEEEGEIAKSSATWPKYVRHYQNEQGVLITYGDRHYFDEPSGEALRKALAEERPGLLLFEGGSENAPKIESMEDGAEVVKRYGEQGYAVWLAKKAGIETKSWDVPFARQIEDAVIRHGMDAILGWMMGQGIKHLMSRGQPRRPSALREMMTQTAPSLMKALARLGADISDENLERLALRYGNKRFEALDNDDAERIASPRGHGETNAVIRAMNELRDRNALDSIVEAKNIYKKIFVTVGSSHAVTWEPALNALYQDLHV